MMIEISKLVDLLDKTVDNDGRLNIPLDVLIERIKYLEENVDSKG